MARVPVRAYLGTKQIFKESARSSDYWTRPSDWLPLPEVPGDGLVGLYAVFNDDSNFCSFLCQNAFTVDWGDGSPVENFPWNATATHIYDWNSISNSTLCSRGYKQVIIKITPQTGQTLTRVNLGAKFPTTGAGSIPNLTNGYSSGWLDIILNCPNLNNASQLYFSSLAQRSSILERVYIKNWGNLASLLSAFSNCISLQSLNEHEWDTSKITSMNATFLNCQNLRSLDASGWNTSLVTSFNQFVASCSSLIRINGLENFDVANSTSLNSMFSSCTSLFSDIGDYPDGVLDLNSWNTSKVTTLQNMFLGVKSLRTVLCSSWDTSKVTTIAGAFNACNLEYLDLSSWDLSKCLSAADSFYLMLKVKKLDLPALSSVTTFGSNFCTQSNNLGSISFVNSGINASIAFTNDCFAAQDLNYIFQNLSISGSGKTVNVAGNYGVSGSGFDVSIATGKGWTVVR